MYKFPKTVFVGHMHPDKINKLHKEQVLIHNLHFFSNTCFKRFVMYYCNLLLPLRGKTTHKYSTLVKNTKTTQKTKIFILKFTIKKMVNFIVNILWPT